MSIFSRVLAEPKNGLRIQGNEIEIEGKIVNIDLSSTSSWIIENNISGDRMVNSNIVEFNNRIYAITSVFVGNQKVSDALTIFNIDSLQWSIIIESPYTADNLSLIVYNNELHVLGGLSKVSANKKQHWKLKESVINDDGSIIIPSSVHDVDDYWTRVSKLPYDFYKGTVLISNNKINIFGGGTSSNQKKHWTFNGTKWEAAKNNKKKNVNLPIPVYGHYKLASYYFVNSYSSQTGDVAVENNILRIVNSVKKVVKKINTYTFNMWESVENDTSTLKWDDVVLTECTIDDGSNLANKMQYVYSIGNGKNQMIVLGSTDDLAFNRIYISGYTDDPRGSIWTYYYDIPFSIETLEDMENTDIYPLFYEGEWLLFEVTYTNLIGGSNRKMARSTRLYRLKITER